MLVRKCLFAHTHKKNILSPGSLSSLEMPCLLSEGCVLPRADGVGDEQSLLSGHTAWGFTCSYGNPLRQWQVNGMPSLGFLVFLLGGVLLGMEAGVVGSLCCTAKLFGVLLYHPPKLWGASYPSKFTESKGWRGAGMHC